MLGRKNIDHVKHTTSAQNNKYMYMYHLQLTHFALQYVFTLQPNPTKCYLDFLSLPNDDKAMLELKQVAAIALSHLDRIAEPYLQIEEVSCI